MARSDAADDEICYEDVLKQHKPQRLAREIDAAETQITDNIKDVRYIVREYPTEVVVQKYLLGRESDENEIYVPDYQRDLVWNEKRQARFIESVLIGLPVPFLFVADISLAEDPDRAGRVEIVDGVQRIRTLARFLAGKLTLSDLERLNKLNGFTFFDLHPSRQRRFKRATLRLIELTETVTEDVRRDMFDRINSGAVGLEAVEIRRGMQPGPFLELVSELARDKLLHTLAPISKELEKRFEYEELVTRFFAFLDDYQDYGIGPSGKVVKDFLLAYVKKKNEELGATGGTKLKNHMVTQWKLMLEFVKNNFPDGFKKTGRGRKVPRVRFEAIAVGTGLALNKRPNLRVRNLDWLDSDDFLDWVTSDAANNRSNLIGRIEFVRDSLLQR